MRTGDGRSLLSNLRRQVERCFGRLELLNEQIKAIEREQRCWSLRCFVVSSRADDNVASFLGLAPAPYASGDVSRG